MSNFHFSRNLVSACKSVATQTTKTFMSKFDTLLISKQDVLALVQPDNDVKDKTLA